MSRAFEVTRELDLPAAVGRVAGGIAAPGSRRSRRDSLPSPGSSHQPVSTRGPSSNGRIGRDLFRGARPTTA